VNRQDVGVSTRTLVILRHAKAANPQGVADPDRPLSQRGHADAAAAGVWLARRGLQPDLVVCSPALRTRQTWHGVALGLVSALTDTDLTNADPTDTEPTDAEPTEEPASGGTDQPPGSAEPASAGRGPGFGAPEVRYEAAVYGASVRTLLASVRAAAPEATTVLLIGHNPGVSALSAELDPEHADPEGLSTAGIAVHTFTGAWVDLAAGQAPLSAAHTARS
jgi:phosphohistidine phosphatase